MLLKIYPIQQAERHKILNIRGKNEKLYSIEPLNFCSSEDWEEIFAMYVCLLDTSSSIKKIS